MVVSILGVIAAIAIPSYNQSLRKSRRSDAKVTLLKVSQNLERCFSEKNSYQVAAGCTNFNNTSSEEGYYTITTVQNATSFDITATTKGAQAEDTDCKKFTLDEAGAEGAVDADDKNTSKDCW